MDPELTRLAVDVPAAFRRALKTLATDNGQTMGDIVFALLTGQPCPVTVDDIKEAFRRHQARESGGQSPGQQKGKKGGRP